MTKRAARILVKIMLACFALLIVVGLLTDPKPKVEKTQETAPPVVKPASIGIPYIDAVVVCSHNNSKAVELACQKMEDEAYRLINAYWHKLDPGI